MPFFHVIHITFCSVCNFCLILVVVAPQFLQFALISFGTSVKSFHVNGLLYTSSATVPLLKKAHDRILLVFKLGQKYF